MNCKSNPQKAVVIKFKRLVPEAVIPTYANDGDMCFDLTATSVEYDEEHDSYIYHTGLSFEAPFGYGADLFVRSKNTKTECYLANHVGKLDIYGYRKEILVVYKNRTSWEVRQMLAEWKLMKSASKGLKFDETENVGETVKKLKENAKDGKTTMHPMDFAPYKVGDRIAQMSIVKVEDVCLVEDELSNAKRGDGFGSSGD